MRLATFKAPGRQEPLAGLVQDGRVVALAGGVGVADVLVGTTFSFAKRARFPESFPAGIDDYMARLFERPAYQRALERASAAPASS